MTLKPGNLCVKILDNALDNVLEIIDLVRNIQAYEGGKIQLKLAPTHLKNVLEESLLMLEPQLSQKKISTQLEIDDHIEILADKSAFIHSVLSNVLTNAIKFSYPESEISINAVKQADDVVLTIKDNGVGIPHTLLDDLFRYDKPTTRTGTAGEQGTGFGMPLVKEIISLIQGRIEINFREKSSDSDNPDSDTQGTEVKLFLKPADN